MSSDDAVLGVVLAAFFLWTGYFIFVRDRWSK